MILPPLLRRTTKHPSQATGSASYDRLYPPDCHPTLKPAPKHPKPQTTAHTISQYESAGHLVHHTGNHRSQTSRDAIYLARSGHQHLLLQPLPPHTAKHRHHPEPPTTEITELGDAQTRLNLCESVLKIGELRDNGIQLRMRTDQ